MAPEVLSQQNYGRKVDIWSLGCTILEIITGDSPWKELDIEHEGQAFTLIGNSNDIPAIPNDISSELKSLLLCCLERDKDKRYSIEEVLNHPFLK